MEVLDYFEHNSTFEKFDDEFEDYPSGDEYFLEHEIQSHGFSFACNNCGKCSDESDMEYELCSVCNRWVCINMGAYYKAGMNNAISSWSEDGNTVRHDLEYYCSSMTEESEQLFKVFCCYDCMCEDDSLSEESG